jgi:restriction system protein
MADTSSTLGDVWQRDVPDLLSKDEVDMTAAWVIRAGRYGERDEWAIENKVSGGGWQEWPDLTAASTREEIGAIAADVLGSDDPRLPGYTGQLWALRERIRVGDVAVLPLKTTREIAIGRVTQGYHYRVQEEDPNKRHVVGVDWQATVPRSAIRQDLLYSLNGASSVFSPSRNLAVARLEKLLAEGTDPGAVPFTGSLMPTTPQGKDEVVDASEFDADIVAVARDQITTRIGEEFVGHDFARLVAALLEAEGFDTQESPPGADGGIDITAGRGLLGLESPRIIVQVKSPKVEDSVIAQLNGLVVTHGADFGLIVTWAGLTGPARNTVKQQRFRVKVWESENVVDAVLRNYEQLPADVRARLPLQRVWMLADVT